MSWYCADDYTEHRDWSWTCDRTNDLSPTCGRAFYISNINVASSHPLLVAGAVILLGLVVSVLSKREKL